jgi:pyruvate/2-oxoglutarate dehydrogenase complex dihydrolipoamide dehydrogenase (E3) component
MNTEPYDAIVIGAGQAGTPLAGALADAGRRTALIERTHVGGTCVNEGCTPTKTMVASARVAYLARRAADFGVRTGPVSVDLARVRQRKRDIVATFRGGSERRLAATARLDLLPGEARFVDARTVEVGVNGATRRLGAEQVFVNAGARPGPATVPGLAGPRVLDSTSIMELGELPRHLLVLGGGYIGLEFAQMFRRFGSEVTVVHRGAHLLSREDDDVADAVREILVADGVTVALRTAARQATALRDNGFRVELDGPDGGRAVEASHVLVAIGRVPNTDLLGLDAAGVRTDERGFITVNDRLETSAPGVWALGDITGGPAFTHTSYDDFRILRNSLLGGDTTRSVSRSVLPYTVFIDPQLGRVGLTERDARARGGEVLVAKMPMSYVARALEMDEPRGFMKAVVDAQTQRILGAAVLGIEGGEVMSILQVAMMGDLRWPMLRDAVFAHPLLAESLNNLFGTL